MFDFNAFAPTVPLLEKQDLLPLFGDDLQMVTLMHVLLCKETQAKYELAQTLDSV